MKIVAPQPPDWLSRAGCVVPDDAHALLECAFHLAPVGLLVARRRIISYYNQAFSAMFGYPHDQLVGQSLDCLYPSHQEFEHTGERASIVMREHDCYSDERIMRHQSGRLFWCHVTGRTFNNAAPLDGATWVFEDISARRQVTAELTRREREIAQLLVLGLSSKAIGRELKISPRTVEAHRGRMMRKLGVHTTSGLVARLIGRSAD